MTTGISVSLDPKTIKDAIEEQVRVSIVEALGRDHDALVRAVVQAAISEKGQGYGQSPFRMALDRMIRDEAERAVKSLLEQQRPLIRQALADKMTALRIVDSILAQALDAKYFVSVSLKDPTEAQVELDG